MCGCVFSRTEERTQVCKIFWLPKKKTKRRVEHIADWWWYSFTAFAKYYFCYDIKKGSVCWVLSTLWRKLLLSSVRTVNLWTFSVSRSKKVRYFPTFICPHTHFKQQGGTQALGSDREQCSLNNFFFKACCFVLICICRIILSAVTVYEDLRMCSNTVSLCGFWMNVWTVWCRGKRCYSGTICGHPCFLCEVAVRYLPVTFCCGTEWIWYRKLFHVITIIITSVEIYLLLAASFLCYTTALQQQCIWKYFTTLGHNCRRWFPRFLWSKKFI